MYLPRPGDVLSRDIEDYQEGIILPIDKPYRWTSADVIRKVKWSACRHFGKKGLKVGHAGTLDPLATGVLLVCIGKATKRAEELQRSPKQYLATVSFGATTPSYDLEKQIDKVFPLDRVSEESLRAALPSFIGEQDQVAPLFCAKSVDGVRAYETARRLLREAQREGKAYDETADAGLLQTNRITITGLDVVSFMDGTPELPSDDGTGRIRVADISGHDLRTAQILVDCSKGTYIRALARDLGEALGSGAFLSGLRRTRSGGFGEEEMISLEDCLGLF